MEYTETRVTARCWQLRGSSTAALFVLASAMLCLSATLWMGAYSMHGGQRASGLTGLPSTTPKPLPNHEMQQRRMPPILPASLSSEQQPLYNRIVAGARDSSGKPLKTRVNPDGSLTGPFNAMLLNPQLGADQMDFLEDLRFGNLSIPHRVVESVILRVAQHFKCGYEFCSHAPMARHAGVSEVTIESLRRGEQPPDIDADQAAALALATEAISGVGPTAVSDTTFEVAVRELGERGVFEVVTLTGYYTALSQVINTFRMPCAAGEPNPFGDA